MPHGHHHFHHHHHHHHHHHPPHRHRIHHSTGSGSSSLSVAMEPGEKKVSLCCLLVHRSKVARPNQAFAVLMSLIATGFTCATIGSLFTFNGAEAAVPLSCVSATLWLFTLIHCCCRVKVPAEEDNQEEASALLAGEPEQTPSTATSTPGGVPSLSQPLPPPYTVYQGAERTNTSETPQPPPYAP